MNIKEQEFYNKEILPAMKKLPVTAVSGALYEKIAERLAVEKAAVNLDKKEFFGKLNNIFTVKVLAFSAALTVILMVVSFNYYQNIQAARYLNARLASIGSADHFYAENYYYQSLY